MILKAKKLFASWIASFVRKDESVKSVFALGSCRLISPLTILNRKGLIDLTNKEAAWYAHNSKEVLQRIGLHQGRLKIPQALYPMVFDTDSCDIRPREENLLLSLPKIAVFEISTRICNTNGNTILHGTCLKKNSFTDFERRVIDFSELVEDLRKLSNLFKHVIIVCNIQLQPDLKTDDIHRKKLNDFLEKYVKTNRNVSIFNPNYMIQSEGAKNALTDNDHYQSGFNADVARYLGELINQF